MTGYDGGNKKAPIRGLLYPGPMLAIRQGFLNGRHLSKNSAVALDNILNGERSKMTVELCHCRSSYVCPGIRFSTIYCNRKFTERGRNLGFIDSGFHWFILS